VVVFRGDHPMGGSGGLTSASPTPRPAGVRDVCILVGADAATATTNVYPGVDPAGMTASPTR